MLVEVSLVPSQRKIHKIPLSSPHPHLPFSPQPNTVPLSNAVSNKMNTETFPLDLASIGDVREDSFSEVVETGRTLVQPERGGED